MYYIRKNSEKWAVHNSRTGTSRQLGDMEIQCILNEFPNLKMGPANSKSLTFYRNRINSINNLP